MGTFFKNSRGLKRSPSSSSSSWPATAAMLFFVAFCVFAVYILASSSYSSRLSSTSVTGSGQRSSRLVFKDRPPPLDESKDFGFIDEENQVGVEREEPGATEQGAGNHISVSENQPGGHLTNENHPDSYSTSENQMDGDSTSGKQADDHLMNEDQPAGNSMGENQRIIHSTSDDQENVNSTSEDPQDDSSTRENSQDGKSTSDEQQEGDSTNDDQQHSESHSESNENPSEGNDNESHQAMDNEESSQQENQDYNDERNSPNLKMTAKSRNNTPVDDEEEQKKSRNSTMRLEYDWYLCNVTAGSDYIPCLDNEKAIKKLHSLKHYEHRERHCPEESPTCLVPLPEGYKRPIKWPSSRDKIWYSNVPRTKLAEVKGHQNWVKVEGEHLTFPGGGTQFIHGALHYIDFIQQSQHDIKWGKHTRVILDVGCGVASFGGYLFDRDVLTMSFAPKDEHEAQVQFALERGIPAISAVMGSQRLSFPWNVFDLVHCARCRVPWHADGGMLLLELNRVLRPGGYFVWSATPVYQKLKDDVEIWKAMESITSSMCWDLVTIKKNKLNGVAAAIYRKPDTNECYDSRENQNPPMCEEGDDPNAAWYTPLQACIHKVPSDAAERGTKWPADWPKRLTTPPYWLNNSHISMYGKADPVDFKADYDNWKHIVMESYLHGLGINWSRVRNVMDMRSVYGGFAAALKDLKLWVMNVVNVESPDTLPVIYERGLFGIYHDWCESFSTYPRTYDLLHADNLFSQLKQRCSIIPVIAEVDRIVRPGGWLIVRDESDVASEVESLLKSLHWKVQLTSTNEKEGIISAEKTEWRPAASS